MAPRKRRLYLGIDVGGTKIQASLVSEGGAVLGRKRRATPRGGKPSKTLTAIRGAATAVLKQEGCEAADLTAVGIAIPGVVDPGAGRVVVTPNMNLSGADVVAPLEKAFGVPVVLGNDANLGALGSAWVGAARGASSAIGIFVGTGIGGGLFMEGGIWRGHRESAGEVGHLIVQPDGPECGCGNRGCLEALASRTAIERDIRTAAESGRVTALTEILDGDFTKIRSGALASALEAGDELVTEVLERAATWLGRACVSLRHVVDPEVIVLGGGVMEACGDRLLPIVREVVAADRLPGARPGGGVLLSPLGDDAVVLGAVALARIHASRSPFDPRYAAAPTYPKVAAPEFGKAAVGGEVYTSDVIVRANGKVRKRKKSAAKARYGTSHVFGPEDLDRACKGGPAKLFVGTGYEGQASLSDEGRAWLENRAIAVELLPTPKAIKAFNRSGERRALLAHVTC